MTIEDLDDCCVIKWRLTDCCNYKCSYCIRRPLVVDKNNVLNRDNLERDIKLSMEAINDVIRIANELYDNIKKPVKIDLIGGEVSLFNTYLMYIMEKLFSSKSIVKVNITTNLSLPEDYYITLCSIARHYNKALSITASFHPEYTPLKIFMIKAKSIYKEIGDKFKCETVITNINNQVEDFIHSCEEIGCHYMCEEDLLDESKRGQTVKNYKSNLRYKVTMDDGKVEYFPTRNEVIKTYGKDGIVMDTSHHTCTRDYNYVYIEKNIAVACRNPMPINQYKVCKEPHPCKFGGCTLCGHISIYDQNIKENSGS